MSDLREAVAKWIHVPIYFADGISWENEKEYNKDLYLSEADSLLALLVKWLKEHEKVDGSVYLNPKDWQRLLKAVEK